MVDATQADMEASATGADTNSAAPERKKKLTLRQRLIAKVSLLELNRYFFIIYILFSQYIPIQYCAV